MISTLAIRIMTNVVHPTFLVASLLLATLILTMTTSADAAMIIRVDDPTTGSNPDLEVADGDAADLFAPVGLLSAFDTLANGQTVSVNAASFPVTGSAPILDLMGMTITGPTIGPLYISATNTGFSLANGDASFFTAIGGTTDGLVSAAAYIDTGNGEFNSSTLIHDFGTFFGPDFSSSAGTILTAPATNFAMTLIVDIVHDDPFDMTSFDFYLSAKETADEQSAPEPSSFVLAGLSLAALGWIAAQRRHEKLS